MLLVPDTASLKAFLDSKVEQYNRPGFIANDPVAIPHQFSAKEDIEIMGFFAAVLAWGQRKTILNKCRELIDRFGGQPYRFIGGHSETDLRALLGFKHRTFNDTDLLYFVNFLKRHYDRFDSLEDAFLPPSAASAVCYAPGFAENSFIEESLNHFRSVFIDSPDFPQRTAKHISSPSQGSTCKRLNMFLRWMVRRDDAGVDFGIWKRIRPSDLVCPCDVHVDRVARQLGLVKRKQTDWQTALELTEHLRKFDAADPIRYDFALFGLGVEEGVGKKDGSRGKEL